MPKSITKPVNQTPAQSGLKVAVVTLSFLTVFFLVTSSVLGFLLIDGSLSTIRTNVTRNTILDIIDRDFIGDDLSEMDKAEGELKGLVRALEDPYSQYLTEEETQEFRDSINEEYQGIGVRFADRDGVFIITQVMSSGPAEGVGVQVDDILTEIEGESIFGQTLDDVVTQIRGPKGEAVNLTFQRGAEEVQFDIVRDEIRTELVTLTVEDEFAIIRISSFGDDMYSKMQSIAQQVIANENVEYVIVDLRSNTGGILQGGVDATSYFIDENDVVAYEVGNDINRTDSARATEPSLKDYPVAIVVDQYSASASEIMAAGIRDNRDNAIIVGQQTFGKGVVQKLFSLPNGGTLKLTIAQWLTPNREEINEIGLTPNVEVDPNDDSIEAAKTALSQE